MKVEIEKNYPVETLKNRAKDMNYMVCAMGLVLGETKRLDEAIQLAEANKDRDDVLDLRIVSYCGREAYYFL